MGTNYSFFCGYGFKLNFDDNFKQKTIEEESHFETMYDPKTGKPYQKKVIDNSKKTLYYFQNKWLGFYDLLDLFEAPSYEMEVFFVENNEVTELFVVSKKYYFTKLDFGNIDIKFQELLFTEIEELNKTLDEFKNQFSKWGCINLGNIKNVYTVVNRIG